MATSNNPSKTKGQVIKIEKFQTTRGEEFATLQAAQARQDVLDFAYWLEEHPELYFDSIDRNSKTIDIAEVILKNFTLTPK